MTKLLMAWESSILVIILSTNMMTVSLLALSVQDKFVTSLTRIPDLNITVQWGIIAKKILMLVRRSTSFLVDE